jgi:hypothetical protein
MTGIVLTCGQMKRPRLERGLFYSDTGVLCVIALQKELLEAPAVAVTGLVAAFSNLFFLSWAFSL